VHRCHSPLRPRLLPVDHSWLRWCSHRPVAHCQSVVTPIPTFLYRRSWLSLQPRQPPLVNSAPPPPPPLSCRIAYRYLEEQVPPRTSSRSRQKTRHANHTLPRVHNLSMNRIAQGSSGAATCPTAPAPAAQPGAAPGSPRILWLQLSLPSPGQLQGRHVPLEDPTVYVLLK
jgi:hypothetical protein